MSRRAYIIVLMLLLAFAAKGQGVVSADSVRLVRNAGTVQLSLTVVLDGRKLPSRDVVVLTPRIVGRADSVDFPPIVVFGRNTYYRDVRHGTVTADITADAHRLRCKGKSLRDSYSRTLDWQPWMENSTLKIVTTTGTPCDNIDSVLLQQRAFTVAPPDTLYIPNHITDRAVRPQTVSGEARVQFIVNRTEFEPTLANNRRELEKMRKFIADVKKNPRVRIVRYRLKGYASPEGPWDNNVRLAKGRTERIKNFMTEQWGVPPAQIATDGEPEDWQGTRDYILQHRDAFPDADAILAIIDSDMEPDPKLGKIIAQHPTSYSKLLRDCFPALRRTSYHIDYTWTDIEEQERSVSFDTIVRRHSVNSKSPLRENVTTQYRPTRPWLAVKTNLLFDLAFTPNIEIEIPMGERWSLMVEDWFPWFLHNRGGNISLGRYISPGNDMKTSSYELWTLGAELRYWWPGKCPEARPRLTGSFLGLYYANGKYDVEWDGRGDQGEFNSVGLTIGHSWPLSRAWNFEASISAGYFWGPRRHYEGEFDHTHLIWKYTGRTRYIGPTKLKLSLVWLVPSFGKRKGGAGE